MDEQVSELSTIDSMDEIRCTEDRMISSDTTKSSLQVLVSMLCLVIGLGTTADRSGPVGDCRDFGGEGCFYSGVMMYPRRPIDRKRKLIHLWFDEDFVLEEPQMNK